MPRGCQYSKAVAGNASTHIRTLSTYYYTKILIVLENLKQNICYFACTLQYFFEFNYLYSSLLRGLYFPAAVTVRKHDVPAADQASLGWLNQHQIASAHVLRHQNIFPASNPDSRNMFSRSDALIVCPLGQQLQLGCGEGYQPVAQFRLQTLGRAGGSNLEGIAIRYRRLGAPPVTLVL